MPQPSPVSTRKPSGVVVPSAGSGAMMESAQGVDEDDYQEECNFTSRIEAKAERELQELWDTLWRSTRSHEALHTAMNSPRTGWNPYRPARGGPQVRREILNSEVAEFKDLVATESLYLAGKGMSAHAGGTGGGGGGGLPLPAQEFIDPVNAALDTAPHVPSQGDLQGLAICGSSVPVHEVSPPQKRGGSGTWPPAYAEEILAQHGSLRAEVFSMHGSPDAGPSSLDAMEHIIADVSAQLFDKMWAEVVVPFYAKRVSSPPSGNARAPRRSSTVLSSGANPQASNRLHTTSAQPSPLLASAKMEDADRFDSNKSGGMSSPTTDDCWDASQRLLSPTSHSGARHVTVTVPPSQQAPRSGGGGEKGRRNPSPSSRQGTRAAQGSASSGAGRDVRSGGMQQKKPSPQRKKKPHRLTAMMMKDAPCSGAPAREVPVASGRGRLPHATPTPTHRKPTGQSASPPRQRHVHVRVAGGEERRQHVPRLAPVTAAARDTHHKQMRVLSGRNTRSDGVPVVADAPNAPQKRSNGHDDTAQLKPRPTTAYH